MADRIKRTLYAPTPVNLMRALACELSERIKQRRDRPIPVPTIFDRARLVFEQKDLLVTTRVDVEDTRLT